MIFVDKVEEIIRHGSSTIKKKQNKGSRNKGILTLLTNSIVNEYKRSQTKTENVDKKPFEFRAYDEDDEASPVLKRHSILKTKTEILSPEKQLQPK